MNLFKKLQNPFVLVGQGFLVGGLLFWAVQSDANVRASDHSRAPSSILAAR